MSSSGTQPTPAALDVFGVGVYLPPAHDVRELAGRAGADTSGYRGYSKVRQAEGDDHPGPMAASALGAALIESGIDPGALSLVLSAGVSRDYPASWSVAAHVMQHVGAPSTCLGLDLSIGCLGTLPALEFATGYLAARGGGYAAVVAAERWSYTVDRSSTDVMSLWAHGDAGGAVVVGVNRPGDPLGRFCGAEFASDADLNGRILIPYGGTRNPVAPPGVSPFARQLSDHSRKEISARYQQGYRQAFLGLRRRFGIQPHRLVCNQIAPGFVAMVADIAGVGTEQVTITGDDSGHLGAVDILYGVRTLLDAKELDGPVALAGSASYGFGVGLLLPPDWSNSEAPAAD
jgi:3-oxoacyl-[acyl-carrier-protein] synthase III